MLLLDYKGQEGKFLVWSQIENLTPLFSFIIRSFSAMTKENESPQWRSIKRQEHWWKGLTGNTSPLLPRFVSTAAL